jgi:hypothetical protein
MTFHSVGNGKIIPTDEHIFQRGRYTTDQKRYLLFKEALKEYPGLLLDLRIGSGF